MTGLFYDVLEVNIAVSVMIQVLCLLSGKLKKRYGAVWILAAVRLVIPYNYSLPFRKGALLNMPGFVQERNFPEDIAQTQIPAKSGKEDTYPVPVYQSRNITSPVLIGIFRPRLINPGFCKTVE